MSPNLGQLDALLAATLVFKKLSRQDRRIWMTKFANPAVMRRG
jgi:hypothetical protein